MIKPRIKGKWFGDENYKYVMWKCEGDTFWFYGIDYAIKSSRLFKSGRNV
jgi:hypothetical protein